VTDDRKALEQLLVAAVNVVRATLREGPLPASSWGDEMRALARLVGEKL
jgi:hypothetical protein